MFAAHDAEAGEGGCASFFLNGKAILKGVAADFEVEGDTPPFEVVGDAIFDIVGEIEAFNAVGDFDAVGDTGDDCFIGAGAGADAVARCGASSSPPTT